MENSANINIIALRRLVLISIVLTIFVIGLGAYTRLTHAGLGCPDWPTCYGLLDVPQTSEQIAAAEKAFPERAVEPEKAWNEMIHRYFAGALGLFIVAIAFISIKLRIKHKTSTKTPLLLPLLALAVVIFQAALGMWTVTLMLMPVIVMGHLLGGFTTLCLLFLLYLKLNPELYNKKIEAAISDKAVTINSNAATQIKKTSSYQRFAIVGIVILTMQIALGGWTSSNYAALSCIELPICQGDWQNQLNFKEAFTLLPPPQKSYEFGHLDHHERLTIHVVHRLGAIVTSLYLLWLVIATLKKYPVRQVQISCTVLVLFLVTQVSLGISNIWFKLPLNVAVAHNLVAALLMLSLISLAYQLTQHSRGSCHE
ncbi:COX15/CtaA family protein [Colwellia asteriadis]|uniref:COX15/CtaA family protein n=1 Tax=Colwellia asteriadis TaxID=517723 RepID=A0ABN1L7A2_9GAMM